MKLFIWDLHGTLEQGNEYAVVDISNKVLQQFGYIERFTKVLGNKLYGLRWYEYYEYLLPNETHERHMDLQEASFALSNSLAGIQIIANHMKPAKNAFKVLDAIASKHQQIVISNTTPASVPIFLRALGMQSYFKNDRAIAVNAHTRDAKSTKLDAIHKYLTSKVFDELIVIGDSDKDMTLADELGAKAYLYAHKGAAFRSEKGHYRINDLTALLAEV